MQPIAIALAIIAALGLAYGVGRHQGTAALQARLDAATVQAQAQAAETSKALAAAEQARRGLSQQLEDAANADPVLVPMCLSVERVRRIGKH